VTCGPSSPARATHPAAPFVGPEDRLLQGGVAVGALGACARANQAGSLSQTERLVTGAGPGDPRGPLRHGIGFGLPTLPRLQARGPRSPSSACLCRRLRGGRVHPFSSWSRSPVCFLTSTQDSLPAGGPALAGRESLPASPLRYQVSASVGFTWASSWSRLLLAHSR
jgi:hypothetical protein